MYTNVTHTRYHKKFHAANSTQGLKVNHKRRFIVFLSCVFVLILSFNIFVKAYAQTNDFNTQPIDSLSINSLATDSMKSIVVQSGDSLWLIAALYKPEDVKINSYIYQLKKVNNLSSSAIDEGQVLYLP
jgi:LysM repeat protein